MGLLSWIERKRKLADEIYAYAAQCERLEYVVYDLEQRNRDFQQSMARAAIFWAIASMARSEECSVCQSYFFGYVDFVYPLTSMGKVDVELSEAKAHQLVEDGGNAIQQLHDQVLAIVKASAEHLHKQPEDSIYRIAWLGLTNILFDAVNRAELQDIKTLITKCTFFSNTVKGCKRGFCTEEEVTVASGALAGHCCDMIEKLGMDDTQVCTERDRKLAEDIEAAKAQWERFRCVVDELEQSDLQQDIVNAAVMWTMASLARIEGWSVLESYFFGYVNVAYEITSTGKVDVEARKLCQDGANAIQRLEDQVAAIAKTTSEHLQQQPEDSIYQTTWSALSVMAEFLHRAKLEDIKILIVQCASLGTAAKSYSMGSCTEEEYMEDFNALRTHLEYMVEKL